MTPTLLRPSMDRTLRHVLLGVALVLFLCTNTVAQAPGDGPPAPGEGRIQIIMHARTSPHGDPPQLLYDYVLNTTVDGDQTRREIRVPLPSDAALQQLAVYQNPGLPTPQTQQQRTGSGDWAVATWDEDGPAPGESVSMRLEARRHIDPDTEIHVEWDRLVVNLTRVWILLPGTHSPVVTDLGELERQNATSGRNTWNLTGTHDRVTFTIRPLEETLDPALAAPPPSWSAYAVIAGLALVSGAVWLLGKKLDARKQERERRQAPRP